MALGGRLMQERIIINTEEYIPLKLIINKDEEPVEYINYSKGNTSCLEIALGSTSGFIKRITLLLCKEYSEIEGKLLVDKFQNKEVLIQKNNVECNLFKAVIYSDGVRIVLSDKIIKQYSKMDRVYVGLSNADDVVEICVVDMSDSEISHLKRELQ